MRRRNFIAAFHARNYDSEGANPLFRKRSLNRSWTKQIVFSLIGAVVVTVLAAIFFGPYFMINSVKLTGVVTLDRQAVLDNVTSGLNDRNWLGFSNRHRWFMQDNKIKEQLIQNFPLAAVSIDLQKDTLIVVVTEDVSTVALISADQVYLLNRDGKVIRTANENETKAILFKAGEIDLTVEEQAGLPELLTNMPILFDKLGHAYTVEQSIYTPEVIDNLIQFNSGLVNLDIQPQELIIEDSQLTWLAVNSDQPWQIYFEAGKNPQEQLTILKAILDDYFATQDSIKYIDVRFGNRVYVK